MRITVDTNVLISGTFWKGDSDRILQKIENEEIELVISKDIIDEFTKVLNYEEIQQKIRDKNLWRIRTVEKIVSVSSVIEPKQKFDIVKEDIDDNKVLECAFEGQVEYIITQDNHLLKLKQFKGIKILTPKEFLDVLKWNKKLIKRRIAQRKKRVICS